jgi:hypothetical protein
VNLVSAKCEDCNDKHPSYGMRVEKKNGFFKVTNQWCKECSRAHPGAIIGGRRICEGCGVDPPSLGLTQQGVARWCTGCVGGGQLLAKGQSLEKSGKKRREWMQEHTVRAKEEELRTLRRSRKVTQAKCDKLEKRIQRMTEKSQAQSKVVVDGLEALKTMRAEHNDLKRQKLDDAKRPAAPEWHGPRHSALDDQTVGQIAAWYEVFPGDLLQLNQRIKNLNVHAKLQEGTSIWLPMSANKAAAQAAAVAAEAAEAVAGARGRCSEGSSAPRCESCGRRPVKCMCGKVCRKCAAPAKMGCFGFCSNECRNAGRGGTPVTARVQPKRVPPTDADRAAVRDAADAAASAPPKQKRPSKLGKLMKEKNSEACADPTTEKTNGHPDQ